VSDVLDVPQPERCSFCDYLAGVRPFSIVDRSALTAILVTREQRGVGHVLVVPVAHRPTLLDLEPDEASAVMATLIAVAAAIMSGFKPRGIAVWQNNGFPANQTIPHVHFHIAGTLPDGGTEFGDVPELSVVQTDQIADALRPFLHQR
jgi:histidine triad (HIT) family protein